MKIRNRNQFILSIAVASAMALGSCKKNNDTPAPAPVLANGTLLFHLHTDVDVNEVDAYGDTLVMTGGRRIVVTKAQLYISGIQLVKSDGSVIAGPSVNVLKVQEEETNLIGSVASGNYQSVKYNIGLSPATNGQEPNTSDPVLYKKDMWFDSTNFIGGHGFVFLDFEGSIDTSADNSGKFTLFVYKIGTNANLRNIAMPVQNFTVSPNQVQEVHMIIDYAKLFTGINLTVSGNLNIKTAADNALPLATQVANNISGMVHYE